ncbi:DUF4245 domain-containing protein [Nocardioides sp.]|uniref:DUF4245 domain-containing protein n=1 Tax=Nocardioides sp. TaxID=35761 RepID=UPI001A299564|nr:DUF4245 domain-containing protein [Nocardioides sp.]MBJ7355983.1 DUF4245 domain-containing protein [Nocardioides sp.]
MSELEDESPREEPSRYSRTTNGLLASLIVTVLAVGAFVVFREAFRDQPVVTRDAVDYLGTVEDAQAGGVELVYPKNLPDGWIATSIDFVPGERPAWGIGMLTADGRYVGLRQEDADVDELVASYVDENAEPGDESGVESGLTAGPWQTWADTGGDLAYSTTLTGGQASTMGETLLVYGSASRDDQEQLIGLLTTAEID